MQQTSRSAIRLVAGAPYNYVPVPDAQGFDPAVTGIQIMPTGTMNAATPGNNPSFNILVRIRIE